MTKNTKKINTEQPEHDNSNYVITNLIYSGLDGEFLHFCLFVKKDLNNFSIIYKICLFFFVIGIIFYSSVYMIKTTRYSVFCIYIGTLKSH